MNDEQILGTFLSTRDAPCPSCGYNLRGINSPVCPECAEPLALKVGFALDTTRALVAAILPPAIIGGAGLCLVLCCVAIAAALGRLPAGGERISLLWAPLVIGALLAAYAGCLMRLRGRIWFRRLPAPRRRLAVACSAALAAGGFALWAVLAVVFTF